LFQTYLPLFAYGIRITLFISLSGTIIGLLIGLVVGGIRAIKVEPRDSFLQSFCKRFAHALTSIYIEVFRGTPMIVQGMFLYHSLLKPVFGLNSVWAGVVIVSINTGAYMAEIIRAGIQSVDIGQSEAARSLGMTPMQSMTHIILPQAIKNAFPAMGNEFVVNIKDTSVLNVISVTELYFETAKIAGSIFRYAEPFFISAVLYFIMTFVTTRILRFIEKRLNHTASSYPTSQTVVEATVKGQL